MTYNLVISSFAASEINEIIEFYNSINKTVLKKFKNILKEIFSFLRQNPHIQIKYKSYRAMPLKGFPFIIIFDVDDENKIVKILSCFHTSQNPSKYPV